MVDGKQSSAFLCLFLIKYKIFNTDKENIKNFCEIPRQTARNFPIIVRGKNFCETPPQRD